jgi:NADH-quinone oxidoreductase subunit E
MSVFSKTLQDKIQHYLNRYETKRSAILPVLHEIQDECGWIQPKHIEALETEYGLHRVHVREVASFYSMYRLEEPKPLRIYFCDNIVCTMMGAKKVMDKIQTHIKNTEKSGKPCKFSLQGVPCLGVCDGAPAMLVNKERHLKVNIDNIDQILKQYESGDQHGH